MLGAAIACNLKKWMNYPEQKRKTAVMAMNLPAGKAGKMGEGLCSLLLVLCTCVMPVNTNNKNVLPAR
jgi:hypothetical protein